MRAAWSNQLGEEGHRSQQTWPHHVPLGTHRLGKCRLLLALSTSFFVAATSYAPCPPAEAGAAALVLQMAQASGQWEQSWCPARSWLPVPAVSPTCRAASGMVGQRKYLILRPLTSRLSLTPQTMPVDSMPFNRRRIYLLLMLAGLIF